MGRPKGSKDLKQRKCKYDEKFLNVLGNKLLEWIKQPSNWWLGEFAIENNMWRSQLDELSDTGRSDYFCKSLKKAKTIQETRLLQLGLARKVDTAMAIFALKNVAGWRDKQEQSGDILKQNITIVIADGKENHNPSGELPGDRTQMAEPSAN